MKYYFILIFGLFVLGISTQAQSTRPATQATQNTAIPSEETTLPKDDSANQSVDPDGKFDNASIKVGAELMGEYLDKLANKKVALVVNQTSMIGNEHLVDALLSKGIKITKIFAPEHGFRGTASAGETIKNGIDVKTNLPIISLYGKNKKPTADQLKDVDVVIFDIQDVGARFYTYISTMHYVMQACAENNKKLFIFDRPNPNGHYIDGPILQNGFNSFVGMHPIPVVHGLTVGELACMIEGEGWLGNGLTCDFDVVKCEGYTHKSFYKLPVKPSPNLPNMRAIYLYPHLCFFEGTPVSVGRGTDFPFQAIGHPDFNFGQYSFTPKGNEGAKYPKHEGKACKGHELTRLTVADLQDASFHKINMNWLYGYHRFFVYMKDNNKSIGEFFNENLFFDKLAGTDKLRKDLAAGITAEEISQSWKADLKTYQEMRAKYLLYEDF